MNFLQQNIDITELSNFKTPAKARWYFELNTQDDIGHLSDIIDFSQKESLPLLFIGGGTNMLFAFESYQGIVIKNNLSGWNYDRESKILQSFSNESIWEIAESLEQDFYQDIWHRFIGLPGSIGGAVYGNAGCFGLEVMHNFCEAKVFDMQTGYIQVFDRDQMQFGYRDSVLKQNPGRYIIIETRFDLSVKREKYHSDVDNIYFRKHKQPNGNSCGSFFKNPSRECSAGYLIEQVGLKGYQIGGAFFSDKHANFLMNDGTASYEDLISLIQLAQQRVKDQFDIELVGEVQIITN